MDQNSSGLCLLFGCAPEVWQDVMSEYHAFSERIGKEVALKSLTEDQLQRLVSSYLNTARAKDGDSIEPFEQESLRIILQRSQGNIRQVLSLCGRVIDEGINQDTKTIAPPVVEQAIQ